MVKLIQSCSKEFDAKHSKPKISRTPTSRVEEALLASELNEEEG